MARIRSIKPEFCTSAQVVECSTNARLLFVLMWMHCDDSGAHPLSARQLKMECFPGDNFTLDEIQAMIDELISHELLYAYSNSGREYLHVTGWKHQKIDKPQPARYPGPSHEHSTPIQIGIVEHSTNTRRTFVPDTIRYDTIGSDKDTIGGEGTREGDAGKTGAASPRSRAARFVRPSFAELQAYCIERGNLVNPQSWLDHYDANGWRVGKNAMKDWKASVRTWERSSGGNIAEQTPEQAVAALRAKNAAQGARVRAILESGFGGFARGTTIEGEHSDAS